MQARTRVTVWFLMAVALAWALPLLANNIRVANVATGHQDIDQQQAYVAFDLSWENTWRNDVNWDAAWVFVKFRPEGSNEWQHAYLSTNKADHLMPSGATVDVGTTEIGGTERGMGVFIYRNGAYTGDVSYVNTRLLWKYGENGYDFARGAQVEFSVHAIEMVYVAEGAFWVGSGGTESGSFTDGSWTGGETIPLRIISEDSIEMAQEDGKFWATGNIGTAGDLPVAFPKGVKSFYCMKYEISQGQYVDFMNKLTTTQASNRLPNQYPNYRHTIRLVGGIYVAEAPDRACNYLTWMDGAAYADWAGLRPMSELEFEKACRGPEAPLANEFAWGSTDHLLQTGHDGEDGSGQETAIPVGANYNLETLLGPVRSGIYATNMADRVSAGASYWGIMELSGNMWEPVVSVGHATGRLFSGSHGDGVLSPAGHATLADWPGYSGGQVTGTAGAGIRGGGARNPGIWHTSVEHLRVSNRHMVNYSVRFPYSGWRGVRTAPSGVLE